MMQGAEKEVAEEMEHPRDVSMAHIITSNIAEARVEDLESLLAVQRQMPNKVEALFGGLKDWIHPGGKLYIDSQHSRVTQFACYTN